MGVAIQLPHFEGPLALLLYLIRKEEMDIFNININEITSQYLAYIRRMKQLDLETAGDFVAMAATLIQIKSQMLLPQYKEADEEETLDPRKELVHKLLEYERFQKAAKDLYELPLVGRDIWGRGGRERLPDDDSEVEIILEEGGLFPLISHYRRVIKNQKSSIHRVATKRQSIASRILQIKDQLAVGQRVILKMLIGESHTTVEELKQNTLITFLSALELGKMGLVSVFQAETYGDIYVTAKQIIEGNMLENVQEYESQENEGLADSLFEDPLPLEKAIEQSEQESAEEKEIASDDEIEQAEKELDLV